MNTELMKTLIDDFNELDTLVWQEVANGNDSFELSVGPWTVKLDLSGECQHK